MLLLSCGFTIFHWTEVVLRNISRQNAKKLPTPPPVVIPVGTPGLMFRMTKSTTKKASRLAFIIAVFAHAALYC